MWLGKTDTFSAFQMLHCFRWFKILLRGRINVDNLFLWYFPLDPTDYVCDVFSTQSIWSFSEYWENVDQSSGQHNQHIFSTAYQAESQQVVKSNISDL